jgi:hypothetical protein
VPNQFRITSLLIASTFLAGSGRGQEVAAHAPRIVKALSFTNQGQPIPQTSVFTPSQDGFFRASVYLELVLTNIGNSPGTSGFCPSFAFTDDSGVVSHYPPQSGVVGANCLWVSGSLPNGNAAAYLFRAKANTPVVFSVFSSGTTVVEPFAYSVYIVIERLF